MSELHLKTLAQELSFPFDHLNKVLSCTLEPPFTVQLKDRNLKFLGMLPQPDKDKLEDFTLQSLQLNMALQSCENLSLGLTPDETPCLCAEFCVNLNYKQLKNQIESFANHLDKISSMIQDLNNKR